MHLRSLLLASFIAVSFITAMKADNYYEKIVLKNGSELEGFTSVQRPGEGLTFNSSRALICLTMSVVNSIDNHEVPLNQLPEYWKEWAEKNEAYNGVGDSRTLSLCDIYTKDRTVKNVRLISNGVVIKYLELSPNSYTLRWDSVKVVSRPKRERNMLSGVNYIVQYTGGLDIEGQCIEQQPGKTISLLTNKNLTEVINVDKITKQRIVPVNPNQTLYQQSCLTDVVMLKNGSTVKGIITETNYGQKDADNNIVILNENNIPQMLMIKDIVEYRKTPNKEYKPVFDKMLPVGDILINGNKVCFTDVKEEQINNNRVIVLQSDTCKMSFKLDTLKNNIIVEANFGAETPDISLLTANKYVQKKTSFIGFSYEDLVKKSIPSTSIETSINKTTKIIFPIKKPGLYLIYFNKKNRVVFFDIK
ncbi:MAG: hypothetical protein WCR53_00405 [Bacteroidaceae bacterium]|nr:hypothetical protein [Bacteroidaceae bacterium]